VPNTTNRNMPGVVPGMFKKKVMMARPALRSGAVAFASSTFSGRQPWITTQNEPAGGWLIGHLCVPRDPKSHKVEGEIGSRTDVVLQRRNLKECVGHLKDAARTTHQFRVA